MKRAEAGLWFGASCLLALLLPPWMIRGDQSTQSLRSQNGTAIAGLAPADRERLQQNFKEFSRLSTQEVAKLRSLHDGIIDSASPHRELAGVMEPYLKWVKTLPPYQRDALLKETGPDARLALITEYLEMQRQDQLNRLLEKELRDIPPGLRRPLSRVPALSADNLNKWMGVIEREFARQLSPSEIEQLSQYSGVARHVHLLQLLNNNGISWWGSEQFWKEVREGTLSGPLAAMREEFERGGGPPLPQDMLRFMIPRLVLMASLVQQLQQENQLVSQPTNEALQKVLAELPAEEQDRLLSLEALEFRQELVLRLEQQQTPVKIADVVRLLLPGPDFRERYRGPGGGPRGRTPFPGAGRGEGGPPGFPGSGPRDGNGFPPRDEGPPGDFGPPGNFGPPGEIGPQNVPSPERGPDGRKRFPGAGRPSGLPPQEPVVPPAP